MQIVIAILLFAVLVLVHEFGHFIVAKRAGVRVEEFAIGFPPRLFSVRRGETEYSINLLPLGGYVRMPGENGETTDAQGNADPRTFGAQTARNRAAILVAGVTMNFLLAWVIYTGLFAFQGQQHLDYAYVAGVVANSPAQTAQLGANDRIVAINGSKTSDSAVIHDLIQTAINSDKTNSATVPITMTILRNGQTQDVTVQARRNPPQGQGSIGIQIGQQLRYSHVPLYQTPFLGIQALGNNFTVTGDAFHKIFTGLIKPSEAFAGPVGIVSIAGQAAQQGPVVVLSFLAYLSWNLAVVNLLPIPGLDGGRLLILGIEVLRRGKRLAPEREALINLAGLVFLLSLIAVITFNDISHLINR
ncbi:MAG: site-2 protease family protein [Ktedonobacterales bacterium]|nr:site-2 protease family protein [Ktedonobacterales bacterium]